MEKPLWAPWRMEFLQAEKPAGCISCLFPAEQGEEADRRNLIVHRASRSFTILNRFPYNNGHVMVVPRAHVARLEDLPADDFADLQAELRLAATVIRAAYLPDGMNVGMNLGGVAGAGIADHLHWHVVPRWGGDTNFMPVLADTKVMVEHLATSWKLRINLSHTGWPWVDEWCSMLWRHPNVYGDISAYFPRSLDDRQVRFMDGSRGRDKVLFGTNGLGLEPCLTQFLALPIKEETKSRVLRDNAVDFLKIA